MIGRVVVVGASVGGIATVRGLRSHGFSGEIVVVSDELDMPHDKPPLSKQVLAGEWAADDISLLGKDGWAAYGADWRRGNAANGLDTDAREVVLADGERLHYDALVIATGASARTLPGDPVPGVHVMRGISDALALRADLLRGGPLVVVGGGFVGAEVAATARGLGVPTTIVESLPTPFFRAAGPVVGELLANLHEEHEVGLITGVGVAELVRGASRVGGVVLSNGSTLEASTVVVGIGVVPTTGWLAGSRVRVGDGVVCDEYGAVLGADGVYAVGDVAAWYDPRHGDHRRVEHWTTATEHGDLVARNLVAAPAERRAYTGVPYFWSDQHGVKIQVVGRANPGDDVEIVSDGSRTAAVYSNGDRFTAAVTLGWPRAAAASRGLLQRAATPGDAIAALRAFQPAVHTRKG